MIVCGFPTCVQVAYAPIHGTGEQEGLSPEVSKKMVEKMRKIV